MGGPSSLGFGLGTNDWGLQEPSPPNGGATFDSWNWGQAPLTAPVASGGISRGPPGLPKTTTNPPPGLGSKSTGTNSGDRSGFLAYLEEKRS